MEMTCMGTVGWLWIMQIVGLTKGYFQVPLIPGSVSEGDVTFLDIWNMELNHDISLERSVMKPGTILTPNDMAMIGLVPLDGPHPLYDDDEESVRLRKEFLLDHMALEVVNEDDPRMEDPEGLTVMNMNGKSLNFHKTDDGSVTVNGLLVHKIKTLDDETVIYEVDDLLFNHQDQVAEAFEAMTLSDPVDRRSEKSTESRHDEVTKSRHNDGESLQDGEVTSNRLNVKVTEGREDVTKKHDKLTGSLHNKEETEKEDSESLHDEVEKLRQNDKVTESVRNVKVTKGRHDVTEKQNDKATESLHDDVTKTRHNEKVAESRRNAKVTEGLHDATERHDDKVTESRVPESLNNEGESKSLHNDKVTRSRRNVKVTEGRHNDDATENLHNDDVTENLHNDDVTENLHNDEVTENLHNEVIESERNEEVIGRQEDVMKEDHKHSQCFAGK